MKKESQEEKREPLYVWYYSTPGRLRKEKAFFTVTRIITPH